MKKKRSSYYYVLFCTMGNNVIIFAEIDEPQHHNTNSITQIQAVSSVAHKLHVFDSLQKTVR